MISKRYEIGQIAISKVNLTSALYEIENFMEKNEIGYVCVTNARTVYLANHDKQYCQIQNNSLLTLPDGAPLVWIANNKGFKSVEKVSGIDFMDAIFSVSIEKMYSHYFFGSTPYTISKIKANLQKKYPSLQIKGAVSPPFQPLEKFDIDSLARELNQLKPTFFWCGLGAPKQERFNALLQPKLEATISVGVGLAFEYIAGTVIRVPKWMQKSGLEGFARLVQQPKRLSRKVIVIYIYTIMQVLKSLLNN